MKNALPTWAGRLAPLALLLLLATGGLAQTATDDFTVILLPDTQEYTQYYPQIFPAQTQWIAAQQQARNIQLVIGLGDIVNDGNSDAQWQNADTAMRTIDQAGIPYAMAIGNHDYDNQAPVARTATKFNQYFGPQRYAGYSWYGGATYPQGSNENFYTTVTMGGRTFLVLVLEFVPRDAVLDWARQVMQANTDKEVLLVTHSYMYGDSTRVDQCDNNDLTRDNDGEETWTKFASQYPNISLVVSGHITQPTGKRVDVGANGNLVGQMLSNYQAAKNGGNGYLRILTFHPLTNTIDVQTYSPYDNTNLTDSGNQFTLKWHADGLDTGTPTIVGKLRGARVGYNFDCAKLTDATVTASQGTVTLLNDGRYSVTTDLPASVDLTVARPGYYSATQTIATHAGYPAEGDFFLKPIMGTLAGHVKDQSGAAIAGATVLLQGGGIPVSKSLTTNATGDYSSSTIPVGDYQVSLSATNYYPATLSATVSENTKTLLNAVLQSTTPPPPPACAATTTGVTICTPGNGATVASPVTVAAGAQSSVAIKFMQVYLDGKWLQTINASSFSVSLTIADGGHRLTVLAKDVNGTVYQTAETINVSSTPPACTAGGDGVTICSPTAGATVASPTTLNAAAQSSAGIKFLQIYVDGVSQQTVTGAYASVQLTMSSGSHRVSVLAKDGAGVIWKNTVNVTTQ